MVLMPDEDSGVLGVDPDGVIRRFIQPRPADEPADRLSCGFTGIHVLEPEVFRLIPANKPWEINRQVYPELIARGRRVCGFVHRGYWREAGSPAGYLAANREVLAGRAGALAPAPRRRRSGARRGRLQRAGARRARRARRRGRRDRAGDRHRAGGAHRRRGAHPPLGDPRGRRRAGGGRPRRRGALPRREVRGVSRRAAALAGGPPRASPSLAPPRGAAAEGLPEGGLLHTPFGDALAGRLVADGFDRGRVEALLGDKRLAINATTLAYAIVYREIQGRLLEVPPRGAPRRGPAPSSPRTASCSPPPRRARGSRARSSRRS